jgi:hypothetical protein
LVNPGRGPHSNERTYQALALEVKKVNAERIDTVEKEQLPTPDCLNSPRAASLRNGVIVADDFVRLKLGSDIDLLVAIPGALVHPNDFPGGTDEYFDAAGDFGGKNHREIQFVASAEIIVDCEIDAQAADVPGLADLGGSFHINGGTNN